MQFRGFIGPTYTLRDVQIAAQQCFNILPSLLEVEGEKTRTYYEPDAGLVTFCLLPDAPVRGMFYQDGRCFAVAGETYCEIKADKSIVVYGKVAKAGSRVSFASNGYGGHQVCAISGGAGYVFDLIANTLTRITAAAFPTTPMMVGFIDGYFVVLDAIANTMHLSALFDGLTYSGLDVAQRSTSSDNLVSMVVDHREVALYGTKTTEAWDDIGANNFPFAPAQGSNNPQGVAAPWSVQAFDNARVWLSANDDGGGMVLRSNGYQAVRMSTHAMEQTIAQYPTIADAEAFTYQMDGRTKYFLCFPAGDATWEFDGSTGLWHQRSWYNAVANIQSAHRARCHAYAFGKHLVGDRLTGQVYEMSPTAYDDAGVAIHRIRTAPHLSNEKKWIYYGQFELDMAVGVGVPGGQGANPRVALSWSNNGGKTFSSEYWASAGAQGEYANRVQWRRLGRSRDRVFRIRMTDPVPWRIADAFLQFRVGTS